MPADQITTAFVKQFTDNFRLVAQQMMSKFRSKVEIEDITGDKAYIDYVGTTAMPQAQASLVSPTIFDEQPHSRRAILAKPYPKAIPVSKSGLARLLADPTYKYADSLKAAFGRLIDQTLMAAAIGNSIVVSTELLTEVSTALPSTQKYAESGTVGMTWEKIVRCLERFNRNDLDQTQRWLALSPQAISDVLLDPDISASDEMALQLVQMGQVKQVAGFQCTMSNWLPKTGNIRSNVAWITEGLCLGINQDIDIKIEPRPDMNYATQVWGCIDMGATRMQETHCFSIEAYEAN